MADGTDGNRLGGLLGVAPVIPGTSPADLRRTALRRLQRAFRGEDTTDDELEGALRGAMDAVQGNDE